MVCACREKTCELCRLRRIDQMKGDITRGMSRSRKTIRETIMKDLKINELEKGIIFDRLL